MNRALPAALVALALLAGCTPAKDPCTSPGLQCGDRCVDGGSDPANCGACGRTCGAGTTCCSGSCVDVLGSDASNCGACGHVCPAFGVCTAGACACPGTLPTQCGTSPGVCADLTRDEANCGTCGERCAGAFVLDAEAACTSGTCVCSGGATDCGGNPRCVSLQQDGANCGACGHACTNHATCSGGACVCGAAAFPDNCGTTPSPVCVNRATDPANCGACGNHCSGSTPSCQAGLCCAPGQGNCSNTCVDLKTSQTHCGSCGHACAAGQICSNGACGCGGTTSLACGASCCAGDACCAGDSCQIEHTNGLGGRFYDCHATYVPLTTSAAAATRAADSWATGNTYAGSCDGACVARQTTGACAIWCYQGSQHAGKVTLRTVDNSCTTACSNFFGDASVSTWE